MSNRDLQSLIDTSCPVIYNGNWEAEARKGWRWDGNVNTRDKAKVQVHIEAAQSEFGKKNVALGQAFDGEVMKPIRRYQTCGIYVRDVENIVGEARKILEDIEILAMWLDEKGNL